MKKSLSTTNLLQIITIVLIVLVGIVTLVNPSVKSSLRANEVAKLGGEENYKIQEKIYSSDSYKKTINQNLNQVLGQLGMPADTTKPEQPTQQPTVSNELSKDKIQTLLASSTIAGNKNAKIILIEYSDFECPFCQKFHEEGTIKQLRDQYGDKVAYIFKNFPLTNIHPLAQKASEAALCVAKDKGADTYYKFVSEVYASKNSELSNVLSIAEKVGADKAAITKCVESSEMASAVTAEATEGQTVFGVNGTPGNVILNVETGKWKSLAGARPKKSFEDIIEELLK